MSSNLIDPSLLGPAGSGSPAPRPPLAGSSTANPSTLGRPRVPPNGVAAPKPAPVLSEAEKAAEATRKTEEKTKKDKSLVEFMEMLDGYEPVVSSFSLRLQRPSSSSRTLEYREGAEQSLVH